MAFLQNLYEQYAGWFLALSALSLFSVVIMMTIGARMMARLPPDYFINDERRRRHDSLSAYHPVLRYSLPALKNLLGFVFLVVGVALLFLPGQGLLTMLAGLALMNFPGKYAAERWLVRKQSVRRSIDWMRRKAGEGPLILD